MRRTKIRFILQAVSLVAVATLAHAEGNRGVYSGFGARLNDSKPVVLETTQPMPHVTMTAYHSSSNRAEKFQVVDEEAPIRFRLMGLPNDGPIDYRVSWKFDENHQGSNDQMLRATETSTVHVRYNTNNPSHRIVELRVASADGHWSGTTSFPISGRVDSTVAADGNVLLIAMKNR